MGNAASAGADIQAALPDSPSPTPIGAAPPAGGAAAAGGATPTKTPPARAAAGAGTVAAPPPAGCRLYRYLQSGRGGSWELVSSSAVPRFYDTHEDAAARYADGGGDDDSEDEEEEEGGARGRRGLGGGASARKKATASRASARPAAARADWFLEVDAGGGGADDAVDARADDRLQYVADAAARRVTFAAGGALWALRFPSRQAYHAFSRALEDRVFCNTYGVANDDAGRAKALGDFKDVFYDPHGGGAEGGGGADGSGGGGGAEGGGGGFAPMEVDAETGEAPPDVPAPGELSERVLSPGGRTGRAPAADAPIHDVIVGGAERSYVVRGGEFDVMRNAEGGLEDTGLTFSLLPLATPTRAAGGAAGRAPATPGGAAAAARLTPPGKAILANRETRVNMLTPGDAARLLHGDIEYGKVVSEWRFGRDGAEVGQADIATESKSAQLGDSSVFLGLDSNRLCKWDVRDRRGVVQSVGAGGGGGGTPGLGMATRSRRQGGAGGGGDDGDDGEGGGGGGLFGATASTPVVSYQGGKDYARGTNFTCMATSGDGYVVVGARDGRLRLYASTTLTQARTSIPGLGRAITSVDVTYDGRWVLATTDDYLMVVKAAFSDSAAGAGGGGGGDEGGRSGRAGGGRPPAEEQSAFVSRGGGKLALPRLLRLKPEDVLLTGGKPLKGGKFTWVTEQGRQERWVVCSCGNYSVVWNFRRVKASGGASATGVGGLPACLDYHLQRRDAEVVTSAFLPDKYAPASGGRPRDSLVVATKEKVFSVGG